MTLALVLAGAAWLLSARQPPPALAIAPAPERSTASTAKAQDAPASPNTPTAPAPAEATGSVLAARLSATDKWLKSSDPDRVTIQLMGSRSEEQLDWQLRNLPRQVEPDRLFVIRTRAGERTLLTVFYGDFASRSEAQAALATLPAALRTFSPRLRRVQGIRDEIAATGS